ncbi:hypothetical protein L2E82_51655 [Cichorium intybus]|nr:hypothetical protein L2E82_51655 [Cichorium intybus]
MKQKLTKKGEQISIVSGGRDGGHGDEWDGGRDILFLTATEPPSPPVTNASPLLHSTVVAVRFEATPWHAGFTMMTEVGIEGFATHLEKLLKTRLNLMFEMLENFQLIFHYMKFPNWDDVSYLCVWEKRKVEVVLFMAILWLL